jgi:hypothetical protein
LFKSSFFLCFFSLIYFGLLKLQHFRSLWLLDRILDCLLKFLLTWHSWRLYFRLFNCFSLFFQFYFLNYLAFRLLLFYALLRSRFFVEWLASLLRLLNGLLLLKCLIGSLGMKQLKEEIKWIPYLVAFKM